MTAPESERILVFDFGSQFAQLIARRVREANQVLQARRGLRARPVRLVRVGQRVRQGRKESRATRVPQVRQVHRVRKVRQVHLEQQDLRAQLDRLDHRAPQGLLAPHLGCPTAPPSESPVRPLRFRTPTRLESRCGHLAAA